MNDVFYLFGTNKSYQACKSNSNKNLMNSSYKWLGSKSTLNAFTLHQVNQWNIQLNCTKWDQNLPVTARLSMKIQLLNPRLNVHDSCQFFMRSQLENVHNVFPRRVKFHFAHCDESQVCFKTENEINHAKNLIICYDSLQTEIS